MRKSDLVRAAAAAPAPGNGGRWGGAAAPAAERLAREFPLAHAFAPRPVRRGATGEILCRGFIQGAMALVVGGGVEKPLGHGGKPEGGKGAESRSPRPRRAVTCQGSLRLAERTGDGTCVRHRSARDGNGHYLCRNGTSTIAALVAVMQHSRASAPRSAPTPTHSESHRHVPTPPDRCPAAPPRFCHRRAAALRHHAFAQETPAAEPAQQSATTLDAVEVTAQRTGRKHPGRAGLHQYRRGEQLSVLASGGTDLRFLSGRVPSLNIESSFGRAFPRFYIRGYGNAPTSASTPRSRSRWCTTTWCRKTRS